MQGPNLNPEARKPVLPTMLVVDDEDVRVLSSTPLQDEAYRVSVARGGASARIQIGLTEEGPRPHTIAEGASALRARE